MALIIFGQIVSNVISTECPLLSSLYQNPLVTYPAVNLSQQLVVPLATTGTLVTRTLGVPRGRPSARRGTAAASIISTMNSDAFLKRVPGRRRRLLVGSCSRHAGHMRGYTAANERGS